MGIVSKALNTLNSLTGKFWDYGDGSNSPIHMLADALTGSAVSFAQVVTAPGSPFSGSTVSTLFDIDVSNYNGVAVYLSGTYTGQAIAYEQTVDGTNWYVVVGQNPAKAAGPALVPVTPSTTGQSAVFPVSGLRMRARIAAISTGTIVAGVVLLAAKQTDNTVYATAVGAAAHAATILGNPVRGGSRAVTANPAAVTTGQTADEISTLVGAKIHKPFSIPEVEWSYPAAAGGINNTTTAVTIQAAAAAGIRNYITGIDISTDGALGAATEVAIRDGAAGTVLWRMKIGTAGLQGGRHIAFPDPLKGTAATLLEFLTLTATTTGLVYFNATGYQAP